jgi:hypothetical protein
MTGAPLRKDISWAQNLRQVDAQTKAPRIHRGGGEVPLKAKDAFQSIDPEGTALNCSIKFHVMSGLPVG